MNAALQSEDLEFVLSLPDGTWALHQGRGEFPFLEGASFGAAWRSVNGHRSWAGEMRGANATELVLECAPQPQNRSLTVELQQTGEIGIWIDISLGQQPPVLYWRVRLQNRSTHPVRLERIDLLRLGAAIGLEGRRRVQTGLCLQAGLPDLALFSNGWGSWNFCGTLGRADRFPRTRLGPLSLPLSRGAVQRQPHGRGVFASEMFGVVGDRDSRLGMLLGFLSQRETFGGLWANLARRSPQIRLWAAGDDAMLDPGTNFSTDWCCLEFVQLGDPEPLANYLSGVANMNRARRLTRTPVGWCSWYQFFQEVTADDVYANLQWAVDHRSQIAFDVLQLDDGFASEVGDWYTTSAGFQDGLTEVSRRIRQAGVTPGLWLAPFVAKPRATILRDHPDWILRNRWGLPANAGFIWDTFTRALDVTHPEVVAHVERLISTAIHQWGFDYLKLDFLYAGALRGLRHDPHRTRAQALRSILERIRSVAGEQATLVGCGCPLGSAIGIFDAMRIGPDVAPTWEPAYRGLDWALRHEPDFPSVRNAARNVIARAPLNGRWWVNDPDCLIMREAPPAVPAGPLDKKLRGGVIGRDLSRGDQAEHASRLTWDETKTLASVVALSGGSFFISDHLPDLSAQRVEWLARLLPPLPRGLRALDWFDRADPGRLALPLKGAAGEWYLVALINWSSRIADVALDLRSLPHVGPFAHAVDFWNEDYHSIEEERLVAREIAPHGVRLFGIRPQAAPQWLGDTLHISQGLVVSKLNVVHSHLVVDLSMNRRASGKVWLEIPGTPSHVMMGGKPIALDWVRGNVYVGRLEFDRTTRFEVGW
jgi:alpha-galactosidase